MYILLSRYEFRVETKQNTLPQQILKFKKKRTLNSKDLLYLPLLSFIEKKLPTF